jgi:hypothetical protein
LFNIFIDPTVRSFDESPYVIERNVMSVNAFNKYYSNYFKDNNTKRIVDYAIANPYYFSNFDYNRIKHASFWDESSVKKFFEDHHDNND